MNKHIENFARAKESLDVLADSYPDWAFHAFCDATIRDIDELIRFATKMRDQIEDE